MLSVERRCAGKRATCSPASAPPAVGRHGRMAHARCRRFRALSARGATSLIRRGRRTPTVRGIPGARRKRPINKCVVHPYLRRYEVLQSSLLSRLRLDSGDTIPRRPFVGATASDDGGRAHRRGPGPAPRDFRYILYDFATVFSSVPRSPHPGWRVPATRVARPGVGARGQGDRPYGASK